MTFLGNNKEVLMRVKASKKSFIFITVVAVLIFSLSGQLLAAKKIPKEKKLALDWLSQPQVVEKFGKISDAIWSYAELGLQEYKSSKLLADTLEQAGFKVERGIL
jgi:aminobenzoyl-glutamate utilization protein B